MKPVAAPVHVVAAVLRDSAGRVLLAQRPSGRDWAGAWEFPGGKCEAGESPETALARELREELGIHAVIGTRLIAVPQRLPRPLCLDVYEASTRDTPIGLEGQVLRWCAPTELRGLPMPWADGPVVAALVEPASLHITPEPLHTDELDSWHRALIERVQRGSIQRVQLRAPRFARAHPRSWETAVRRAAVALHATGVDCWVNEDALLARAANSGLHLPARRLMAENGPIADLRLAASCHSSAELERAQALGCEFALLGPVRTTHTHPDALPLGWARFAELRACVALPVYALGGLRPDDLPTARAHGAQGIAAIRGYG